MRWPRCPIVCYKMEVLQYILDPIPFSLWGQHDGNFVDSKPSFKPYLRIIMLGMVREIIIISSKRNSFKMLTFDIVVIIHISIQLIDQSGEIIMRM